MIEQEHQRNEAAVHQGEEQFRNMADSAPVLIWQTDVTGVTFVNRYYLEFFAQPLDGIKGMGWASFLHPDDAAAYIEAYRAAFERRERYEFQCRFLRHDGKYRWLQNVGEPHYALDRSFLGFVGCSVDVTDIKAAEVISQRAAESDAFRLSLTDALRSIADPIEIQATAARILGESLGASRVIYLEVVSDSEEVIVHKNYTDGVAELSGRYRLEDYHRNLTADHQAGRTQIVTDIPGSSEYTDAEKARYGAIDIAAHIDVPLIKNNQFLALLAVHQAIPRQWTEAEVKQVEETAERTWAAVERARIEVELQKSQAQYRQLFESIDEGYFIADVMFDDQNRPIDLSYLEANPAVKRITGLDLAGRSLREIDPNYESHWWETYGRVAQTGIGERQELYAEPLKSWFNFYAFKVGGADSHRVAAVFQDVTERKNIEQERDRFLAVGSDLQVIISNDGYFRWVSPTFERLLGWSAAEMTACPWSDFVHPDDVPDSIAEASSVFSGNETFAFENRYRHKDGSYRWFLWNAQPHLDEGVIYGAAIDITERKLAEAEREQLLQREQTARETAENANRIKDEFLAVLSHELRSPLNPILGWTRLLQTGKLDATRQREALATIERNAKLQTQLIEDLLDISRIMQGKLSLTVTPVSLPFVIAAAVETVRLAAEAKQIQLQLDLDDTVAFVSGDAARLQQVVWNLLTNAVKFTSQDRQVTVELRQIDRFAQIRVTDTGKGISADFLPHVFEYFRQEDGSTTRKFGGLGLGLAIVRQIVEMHGGTVRAESQGENQGATFIVQLPTMQQTASLASEPIQPQTDAGLPLAGVQILLVDDEPDTREFQAFLLEQSGARVTAVASGLEVLQALEQSIPDVLVSDIGMAEMDGYMLLQQIRSRPSEQGGNVPAIALTAYATEIDQQRAIQVGFQTHITKPVEPEELVKAIATSLERT